MSFVLSHGPGLRKQAVTQSGALISGPIFGVTISSGGHTICRMIRRDENLRGATLMALSMLAFVLNDGLMKAVFDSMSIYQACLLYTSPSPRD